MFHAPRRGCLPVVSNGRLLPITPTGLPPLLSRWFQTHCPDHCHANKTRSSCADPAIPSQDQDHASPNRAHSHQGWPSTRGAIQAFQGPCDARLTAPGTSQGAAPPSTSPPGLISCLTGSPTDPNPPAAKPVQATQHPSPHGIWSLRHPTPAYLHQGEPGSAGYLVFPFPSSEQR